MPASPGRLQCSICHTACRRSVCCQQGLQTPQGQDPSQKLLLLLPLVLLLVVLLHLLLVVVVLLLPLLVLLVLVLVLLLPVAPMLIVGVQSAAHLGCHLFLLLCLLQLLLLILLVFSDWLLLVQASTGSLLTSWELRLTFQNPYRVMGLLIEADVANVFSIGLG